MAIITLRDYQEDLIADGRQALKASRRVLMQLPTGGGKTPIASYMAGQASNAGRAVWFVCHRAELVEQTCKTFKRCGIDHGIIAAGYPMTLQQPVQVCSIDTLKNRLAKLPPPSLIIWDECHHVGAAGWAKVMDAFPRAYHVGLTATPWRLDGTGLGGWFDDMVCGPSVAWLIENGYLSPYRYIAPPMQAQIDLSGSKSDKLADQAKELDRPKLIGDAISHWEKYASGMRSVGFATTVAHSRHLADQFTLAGIPAAHLDGGTPKADRRAIIRDFAAGNILHLFNVSLFGEGFDLSAIADCDVTIDCVSMHRQTQSLSLFLQMVGRALRPADGKTAVILDHGSNYLQAGFGLPDDEREWTLEGRQKGTKKAPDGPPPPVVCDECFNAIRRPLPQDCPHCGKRLQAEAKPPKVAEGDLVEIGKREMEALERQRKQQEKREQAEADTLEELAALAQARGYKNPQRWAWKVWSGRQAKVQSSDEQVA